MNQSETNPNEVQLPASVVDGPDTQTSFSSLEQTHREYLRQLDEEERRANGGGTYSRFDRPEDE